MQMKILKMFNGTFPNETPMIRVAYNIFIFEIM